MRISDGSEILSPDDPHVNNIGIIHVQSIDKKEDRQTLLTRISFLQQQGRTNIAIVLEKGQNALTRDVDFEGLSQHKYDPPVYFAIVTPEPKQANLARKYNFPVHSNLKDLAAGMQPRQQNSMNQAGYDATLQPGYIPPSPASNKSPATQRAVPQQQLPPIRSVSFGEAMRPVKDFLHKAVLRKQKEAPDQLFSTIKIAHDIGCEPQLAGRNAVLACAGCGFKNNGTGWRVLHDYNGLANEMQKLPCSRDIRTGIRMGFRPTNPNSAVRQMDAKQQLHTSLIDLAKNCGCPPESIMFSQNGAICISEELAAKGNHLFDKEARRNAMDLMAHYHSGKTPNLPVTSLHQHGKPSGPERS